jgi:hypothetical protein
MNREDIIRLAEQAGNGEVRDPFTTHMFFVDELERFAALVAAAEREACATLVETILGENPDLSEVYVAAEIRERGKA